MNSIELANWKKEIAQVKKAAGTTIRKRGERIYENAHKHMLAPINMVKDEETNGYSFLVPSERKQDYYHVLAFWLEGDFQASCNCHMEGDQYSPCKHIIAALIFLEHSLKQALAKTVAKSVITTNTSPSTGYDNQPFIFPSSMLKKEYLQKLIPSFNWNAIQSKMYRQRRTEIVKNIELKKISSSIEHAFNTSITHTAQQQLTFACNCPEMDSHLPCKHILSLCYLIIDSNQERFFRQFDDFRAEKAALLERYQLTPEDELAREFSFYINWDGHLIIHAEPSNLFLPQQTDKWQNLKQSMSISQPLVP